MTQLRFRNVDVDPSSPVASWPPEAIETALDRGTLADWRRLSAEIRRSPWGTVSRVVDEITGWGEHPGLDALMKEVVIGARRDFAARARRRWAAHIAHLRRDSGLTLKRFAELAGTSASRLSDYEHGKVSPTTDVLARLEHVARLVACERDDTKGDEAGPDHRDRSG